MKGFLHIKFILLLALFSSTFSSTVSAGTYLEFSPGLIRVDTPAMTFQPLLLDVRLGYEKSVHQFELAFMSSITDDKLNQLTVEVPAVVSVFYHYVPVIDSSLKFHFIVGASHITVDSSFPGIADSTDNYYGVSYGIGFEESFKSMPQLKISADLIQLYRGDQINVNAASLGIHYEF